MNGTRTGLDRDIRDRTGAATCPSRRFVVTLFAVGVCMETDANTSIQVLESKGTIVRRAQ